MMKRKFLLRKLWVPLMLLFSQMAFSQTFTFNNWWGLSKGVTMDADECGTIKKVVLTMNEWAPAHIQILCNGKPMGKSELVSYDPSIYYEGNGDGDPAWRVKMDNSGQSWSYTFYINTRVTPYRMETSMPSGDFNISKAEVSTPSDFIITAPDMEFLLKGKACSSVDTATFSYQWKMSTDGGVTWKNITGATDVDYTGKLTKDSTYFALESNIVYDELDGTDTIRNVSHKELSAPILLTFKKATVSLVAEAGKKSQKFNANEFEVKDGGSIKFTAETSSFSGKPTYVLQKKTLEHGPEESSWEDVKTMPDGVLDNFEPENSAEYRVKVTGTSKYSGLKETVYSAGKIVVRKVYLVDTEKFEYDILWREDFGTFPSATKYVDSEGNEYSNTMTMPNGESAPISNYWAADPFDYVKEHEYAAFSPDYKNNTRDWCSKYRLEDGYYIITSDPYKGDGKYNKADRDYWEAEDHTAGDTNGGMLFLNCKGNLEGVMIYERKLSLSCPLNASTGVWVIFSAFINNAVYKEGSDTPVNVRLEILDKDDKVVYSVSSGDVNQRKGSLGPDSWANMSFKFLAQSQDYTFRLYNNAPGGVNWGNDILLDDISVTLCYPKVQLIALKGDRLPSIGVCLDEEFEMVAFNEDGIDQYIGTPKYLYQYSSDKKTWKDYGSIVMDSIVKVKATKEFLGTTYFRVIVASDEAVVRDIANGKTIERNCATVYATDDGMVVRAGQMFDLTLNIDPIICKGQDTLEVSATPVEEGITPTEYYWYFKGELIDTTTVASYVYRSSDTTDFSSTGNYEVEVRAIDDACQKSLDQKSEWAESNRDEIVVKDPLKLGLDVDKKSLSWGEKVNFTIDLNGYDQDSLLMHEEGGLTKSFMMESAESYVCDPSQNGEVSYYLTAPEGVHCVAPSDTVMITVDLVIPNLITPHNDGDEAMNNTFLLGKGFQVEIFNRYQQLIFEGPDGWDATYKGMIAEPGTYYYRVFLPNGEVKKGTLEVGKFK